MKKKCMACGGKVKMKSGGSVKKKSSTQKIVGMPGYNAKTTTMKKGGSVKKK